MKLKAIITDIEGTTSSIHFVHEVLFPFARAALPGFVNEHRDDPQVRPWLQQVADEIGCDIDAADVVDTLLHWIDIDRKHTALKALQGMIWASGYAGGDFRAHVYPEVADRLRTWQQTGLRLFVYSSGSIAAQKLFFGHSEAGDLLPLFEGFFDTTSGGKREADSYRRILGEIGLAGDEVVFLSDVVAELDAAREAGLHTVLLEREQACEQRNGHPAVGDFDAIVLPG